MTAALEAYDLDALVGLNLRHLREDAGLTRLQLAERIAMHPECLACVEDGLRTLTAPEMVAVWRALRCGTAALWAEPRAERLLQ